WDLANGASMGFGGIGVELTGHGGIDPRTLAPNGRLVRVSYIRGADDVLRRKQTYLDDPVRPEPWSEIVAGDVQGLSVAQPNLPDAQFVMTLVQPPPGAADGAVTTSL